MVAACGYKRFWDCIESHIRGPPGNAEGQITVRVSLQSSFKHVRQPLPIEVRDNIGHSSNRAAVGH